MTANIGHVPCSTCVFKALYVDLKELSGGLGCGKGERRGLGWYGYLQLSYLYYSLECNRQPLRLLQAHIHPFNCSLISCPFLILDKPAVRTIEHLTYHISPTPSKPYSRLQLSLSTTHGPNDPAWVAQGERRLKREAR